MGVQRTSFDKLQRERNKKAKAAAKRARREERAAESKDAEDTVLPTDAEEQTPLSPDELLRMVAHVHEQFDAGKLSLEEFEEQKNELLARLPVD